MNERIYKIDDLLNNRQFVTFDQLVTKLEVSPATVKRDLQFMRDRFNAPIIFDRELGGYRLDRSQAQSGKQYALPGLWFKAEEIHALLTMQHLLSTLDNGGLLGPHIQPLMSRLRGILGVGKHTAEELQKRVILHNVGSRDFHLDYFQTVGSALLQRKRIDITYHARGSDTTTQRTLSPQRLGYYKSNWYLDAWCHLRNDIRNFSIDAISRAEVLEQDAIEVPEDDLNEVLGTGYGIFTGRDVQWATLLFTPERARWVAAERWHPKQESRFLKDGQYELRVPFNNDREIIFEILRHGANVKVISPASLKMKVSEEIRQMARVYGV